MPNKDLRRDKSASKAFARLREFLDPGTQGALPKRPRGNTDADRAISPLRYPGSKRQLLPVIESAVERCGPVSRFVEPFAGGASVALQLAADESVKRIILADVDELVYSFWRTAAYDTTWLIEAMWDVEVTVRQWEKMRDWEPTRTRDRALKCLFLNRTSFSGILNSNAGPIGGLEQKSQYTIDCRFPKSTLHHRIALVGRLAEDGRVEDVWHLGWEQTIKRLRELTHRHASGSLIYLDPPFYAKAANLYRYAFDEDEHTRLAAFLRKLSYPWVLSYDDHPAVQKLYSEHEDDGRCLTRATVDYRAASSSRQATELIVTNIDGMLEAQ